MNEQEIQISTEEILKAAKVIKKAKKRGFEYCDAVFIIFAGNNSRWIRGKYLELLVKAHPTRGDLDWGRGQGIEDRCKFVDGKLICTK